MLEKQIDLWYEVGEDLYRYLEKLKSQPLNTILVDKDSIKLFYQFSSHTPHQTCMIKLAEIKNMCNLVASAKIAGNNPLMAAIIKEPLTEIIRITDHLYDLIGNDNIYKEAYLLSEFGNFYNELYKLFKANFYF